MSVIATEGAVTAIIETPRGVYAETDRGTLRLSQGACEGGICTTPDVIRALPEPTPEGALPDGKIATASEGKVRAAWFGQPTERYQHCVLGDCIEAGSLHVQLQDGSMLEHVLPADQVFEDITPRLFDLDGDGSSEIVTIRASNSGGGAVVIYALRDGALVELATSSENGRPNRWLNIAQISAGQILFVRTPHIGGRLAVLQIDASGAVREENDVVTGMSNHVIGSRELDLQETVDLGGQSVLVIPSQSRDSLRLISGNQAIGAIALPARIDRAIASVGNLLVTATEDGRLLAIEP
ncbi:MAG: hypothetical protein AAF940_15940 [Pseudomonadota bacterium]